MRQVMTDIKRMTTLTRDELMAAAKELGAPFELVLKTAELGTLPVPNFAAGGIATPADAALMTQLGAQAVFVGSGIFAADNPEKRAAAIVKAVTFYDNPAKLVEVSTGLGEAMRGIDMNDIPEKEQLQHRGW